ncbi:MAG: cytochrome c biogenesis protein CcdA [Candidatus Eisenbacteria bacterium]|nr:cytochrome c biogenesis protein CcdA [Candidatus Eisenbacteria bacterium]
MFEGAAESLAAAVQGNLWAAPFAAFAGGLLTAANPCVIAMVPLMIGYVAGQERAGVRRSFLLSLGFAAGLTAMFALLFLVAWTAGSMLRASWWRYVAVAVCLFMGLHLVGVFRWSPPGLSRLPRVGGGLPGAFLLGLLFGLVSLPCAGPILLALLAVVPLKGTAFGAILLGAYSLGHCGLVLAGGTSMGLVQKMANSRGWTRGLVVARRAAGALVLVVGISILFTT